MIGKSSVIAMSYDAGPYDNDWRNISMLVCSFSSVLEKTPFLLEYATNYDSLCAEA